MSHQGDVPGFQCHWSYVNSDEEEGILRFLNILLIEDIHEYIIR